jgi:hypothetical protein
MTESMKFVILLRASASETGPAFPARTIGVTRFVFPAMAQDYAG